MRRILAAAAALGVLSAVSAAQLIHDDASVTPGRDAPPERVPVRDGGASSTLGAMARIAASQASATRTELRRCARARRPARARCEHMALAHVAAGAKLNGVILRAAAPRATGRACAGMAARLGRYMDALGYLAVDGTRSLPWPDAVHADAVAVAGIAARVHRTARTGACVPGAGGPRA